MSKTTIINSAFYIMAVSLMAKLSSFFVEILVASSIGVSNETDAFYMVYGLVQIIYPMISVGIWKVYLPAYKTRNVLDGNSNRANEITDRVLTLFSFLSISTVIAIVLLSEYIIRIFAPGFDTSTIFVSSNLLKIVSFIIFFNTLTTFTSAILQSNSEFLKSQIKDILFFIPALLYLAILRDKSSVDGLSFCILSGAFLSTVNGHILARKYYKYAIPSKLIDKDVLSILKQTPVACINSVINQLNPLIDKVFASTLVIGSITYLNFGSKLIHVFEGLFATAISTALFPHITELIAKKDFDQLRSLLKKYIILISSITFPISTLVYIYPHEIVELIFGYGNFTQKAVHEVSLVFFMYSLGLFGICITTLINDVFYILKRTNILLWTTIVNIISNIILDIILIDMWQVAGLALATTLSLFVSLSSKLYFIKDVFKVELGLIKQIITVLVCCMISLAITHFLNVTFTYHGLTKLFLGIFVFSLTYLSLVLFVMPPIRNALFYAFSLVVHRSKNK